MASRRSNLHLVAERAGVSIASVSRVLNGLPASQSVTERVQRAASELGYVPDATARSLKVGRTEQISLAVADVGNPVYVSMMHAVAGVLTESGYRLVISSTGNDPDDQIAMLDNLKRGFVDGMILSPLRVTEPLLERIRGSRLPLVIIGSLPDSVDVDSVRADSREGIGLAVEHLAEQGRRRIAFLNGPVDTVPGTARLAGYLTAMDRIGLPTSADMQVEAVDFTFAAGTSGAETLLDQCTPDAIVCSNDLLAVAAMKVVTRRGLSIPRDVAIVGMDDTDIAQLTTPTLSSVDLGAARRARTAAQLLLDRLADPNRPVRRPIVRPSLTVRESSTAGARS